MEELLAYLNSIHPLSEEAIQYLSLHLKEIELSRKDYLLKAGRVCENVYFIKKGLVRCFYVKDDNEVCSWFMKEGDLIFSVKSFYKQVPSDESIQVLEDLTAYYLSYKELQHVYNTYPELNFIRGALTEKYYLLSEERSYSIRMQRAHERYHYLMDNHTELIQRVPSKYLASYLGISDETLSRIRAGKKY